MDGSKENPQTKQKTRGPAKNHNAVSTKAINSMIQNYGKTLTEAFPKSKQELKDCLKIERPKNEDTKSAKTTITFESIASITGVIAMLNQKKWRDIYHAYLADFRGNHVLHLSYPKQIKERNIGKQIGCYVKFISDKATRKEIQKALI